MSTLESFILPHPEPEMAQAYGLIDEIIKGLSPFLPAKTLVRYVDETVEGEFLWLANIKDYEGQPVDLACFYKLKVPVMREHNHVKQLRIKFLAHGLTGLLNYVNRYWRASQAKEMRERIMAAVYGYEFRYDNTEIEERLSA